MITHGIKTLMNLKTKIIEDNQKEPDFCLILTACGDAYTTLEGIHVVPINMLKD